LASKRLEKLLAEITDEVSRSREEDREALAVWFNDVLQHEHNKNVRTVGLVEALGRAHGLGDTDGDDPGHDRDPAA
jgi:hypothetical protein